MKKIIALAIMAALSIVTIVVLTPIVSDFADNIQSKEYNPEAGYDLVETHRKVELEMINGTGFINGDPIRTDSGFSLSMVMFTDTFLVTNAITDNGQELKVIESDGEQHIISELVMDDGEYTGTTTNNETFSGEYGFCMRWKEDGTYTRVSIDSRNPAYYVDADATVYVAWYQNETNAGIAHGTLANQTTMFKTGNDPTYEITYTSHTDNPDVEKITAGITSGYVLFVPSKYSVITSQDAMTQTLVELIPLFLGIMLFACMSVYLVRSTKF